MKVPTCRSTAAQDHLAARSCVPAGLLLPLLLLLLHGCVADDDDVKCTPLRDSSARFALSTSCLSTSNQAMLGGRSSRHGRVSMPEPSSTTCKAADGNVTFCYIMLHAPPNKELEPH
jgi:hypothetical protein